MQMKEMYLWALGPGILYSIPETPFKSMARTFIW